MASTQLWSVVALQCVLLGLNCLSMAETITNEDVVIREISSETGNDAHLISEICSQTQDPPLCLSSFADDPRSPTADLKALGQISIDFSLERAVSTLALVEDLSSNATESGCPAVYGTCLECYTSSVGNLHDCTALLNSGDYSSLNVRASAAMTDADTCDDTFAEATECNEPQLGDASHILQGSCSAILVISNMLLLGQGEGEALRSS